MLTQFSIFSAAVCVSKNECMMKYLSGEVFFESLVKVRSLWLKDTRSNVGSLGLLCARVRLCASVETIDYHLHSTEAYVPSLLARLLASHTVFIVFMRICHCCLFHHVAAIKF